MVRLEQESEYHGIIVLKKEEEYTDLVAVKDHRPYDVVFFLNLMQNEQEERCPHCAKFEKQLPALTNSFIQDRKNRHENLERRVFFVMLYIDRENDGLMKAFGHSGYGTVPWISVSA